MVASIMLRFPLRNARILDGQCRTLKFVHVSLDWLKLTKKLKLMVVETMESKANHLVDLSLLQ
jgi:hypothetical protein